MKENINWLKEDCKNILKEIELKEANIVFKITSTDFGSKKGKLLIKNNNFIIVTKDYNFTNGIDEDIEFHFSNNSFN